MLNLKNPIHYLVPERIPPIFPISALGSNFNPQNTLWIHAVKLLARLELEKIFRFSFRHCYAKNQDFRPSISGIP